MREKPWDAEVARSSGKTVYVDGIRIFEDKGTIHITSNKFPDAHAFCPRGSSIEKFFRKYLE